MINPALPLIDHFPRARDDGGQAIHGLGATRIGHAVRAVDDPALVEYLAQHQIGIEANLTSNVQTSTVRNYAAHPLKSLLNAGVLATINSDDPGISAITLPYEYTVAAPAAGLSVDEIELAQRHALTVAFLSPAERQALATAAAQRSDPQP